jgi:hypothetical protein
LGVRDVVAEHAVDHVADGVGETGDFAVAGAGSGWIVGFVDYWIDGWRRGWSRWPGTGWRIHRLSVPGTGQTGATGARRMKDSASGGWADFAGGLGFWISHMV